MQIDRNALEQLLKLNDRQLMMIVNKLARDSGIDPSEYNMDTGSITSIRNALSSATDSDLQRIAEQYEENKKRGSKR